MCVCVEMRSASRMTLKPFSLQRLLTYGTTFFELESGLLNLMIEKGAGGGGQFLPKYQ